MQDIYTLDNLSELDITISKPSIIFLYWDLWAWKTTLSSLLIRKILGTQQEITSPTYVYYNKYQDIYHFDLYRISSYDEFVSIGWEEVLDNNIWIVLIEWPEIIEKYYKADIQIHIEKSQVDGERKINIKYKKEL